MAVPPPTPFGPFVSHPVVVHHGDVDLDLLAALEGLQRLPLAVGGAVDVLVFRAALQGQQKVQYRRYGEDAARVEGQKI